MEKNRKKIPAKKKSMRSAGSSSSNSDDNGYEADDEDSECSLVTHPLHCLSTSGINPPRASSTFCEPEVTGLLLTADVHHNSTAEHHFDPNHNNNRSILDPVRTRGTKRKLDEYENEASTSKRQKTYHLYTGHIRGVKRKFQGDYSEQVKKRLKLSPEEEIETRTIENKSLLPDVSPGTEIDSEVNTSDSSVSILTNASLSPSSSNSLDENMPEENNKAENVAFPCPKSCICRVKPDINEDYNGLLSDFGSQLNTSDSDVSSSNVSLSGTSDDTLDGIPPEKNNKYEREALASPESCVCHVGCSAEPETKGKNDGSDVLNREYHNRGWWIYISVLP